MKQLYQKVPTVYQMEASECGAASLAMIFACYGRYMPLEEMRVETGVSRDGCNAANILKAARKYGFFCRGIRKEPEGLLKLKPPCILHWNINHFVVYEGVKHGHVYINDPAFGRRKLTLKELNDCFTGIVLTFEPTENFKKQKKNRTFFHFIKERLTGQYPVLLHLLAVGLLLVFPGLLLPAASQVLLDEVIFSGNSEWFSGIILAMLAGMLLESILTWHRGIVLQKLQAKLSLLSAHKFLSHLFRLPVVFYDQRSVGDLSSRIENSNHISTFLAGELAQTVLNLFSSCFYLVLMLIYSPVLTGIGILGTLCSLLVMKFSSIRLADASIKIQQDGGKLTGVVCGGLKVTSSLKAAGAENDYVSRILGSYAQTIRQEQDFRRFQQFINLIPQTVSMISGVLVLLFGGMEVIRGSMTMGMLVAFHSLLSSFQQPVSELVGFIRQIQTLKADMSRVDDIMNYQADVKFIPPVQIVPLHTKLSGSIDLNQISFGYSRFAPPLVENFSFHLECGKSIALVGSSGCGKSTVSKIISGLYVPWTGEIRMDDIPVSEIPAAVKNASISTVSQHITLFSGSIRDNITMWNSGILESDMIRAAKDACIHETIIQKPGAYDYRLSEDASNLSGGQKQRLEIARALAVNPSVLIMDEATSALDPVTEKKIMDNIKRRGCTCVVIAHRLSAIRDCDQIIVMDHGKIVEQGSHESLLQTGKIYKTFVQNM